MSYAPSLSLAKLLFNQHSSACIETVEKIERSASIYFLSILHILNVSRDDFSFLTLYIHIVIFTFSFVQKDLKINPHFDEFTISFSIVQTFLELQEFR